MQTARSPAAAPTVFSLTFEQNKSIGLPNGSDWVRCCVKLEGRSRILLEGTSLVGPRPFIHHIVSLLRFLFLLLRLVDFWFTAVVRVG
jgi:hypothetical protein